jgi:hypothetical protein
MTSKERGGHIEFLEKCCVVGLLGLFLHLLVYIGLRISGSFHPLACQIHQRTKLKVLY